MSGAVIPVRVALRCRPLDSKEIREGCQTCLEFVPKEPQLIIGGSHGKDFTFDYVFQPDVTQDVIYNDSIKRLITHIFNGYNVTILAYGQTGSGKTYTMGTVFSQSHGDDPSQAGIIPRAVRDLFTQMEEKCALEFSVKVSFLEIHNEVIIDLLNPRSGHEEVVLREDPSGGVKLAGLCERPVASLDETMSCLELGSSMRTTAATAMNAHSSRSHAIFTITMDSRNAKDGSAGFQSKLHFVDLAGSERVKKTKAQGERFKEGININLGLLALGNVISALCEGSVRNHVPYRESKLTRLLQDSLGGNSHTVMIACVSPADSNMEETLNTLRYAHRTRKIKNKPIVNRDPQMAEVARLRSMVQQLQSKLENFEKGAIKTESGETVTVGSEQVKYLISRNQELELENDKLARELQMAIDHSTEFHEMFLRAEVAKDKMKLKLDELQQTTETTIDIINQSLSGDKHSQFHEQISLLQGIRNKVSELQEEHNNSERTIRECVGEMPPDSTFCGDEDRENVPVGDVNKELTLRQVDMNRKLHELNKVLALKEELASRLVVNDDKINAMKQHYEISVKELEGEVAMLQQEKEELSQALHAVQTNVVSNKISEQRRKRLQELEEQISVLKKKILEYSKIAKMKEQSDGKVKTLNSEILELKQARVRLVKQMRADADKLRQFKLEKEKEVSKLKQQDQKRQVEIVRKQQQFDKQQNVLKRKMEEAVAANKRLKDALLQQRLNTDKRNKEREQNGMTGAQKVRRWIEQDIELSLSTKAAAHHLETLLQDRKTISEELTKLRHKVENWGSSDSSDASVESSSGSESSMIMTETKERVTELENELQLRSIQINDIQQKILAADQEEKGKIRWNGIQSMVEAKYGLRFLFDTCVSTKSELALLANSNMELEACYKEAVKCQETLQQDIEQLKLQHEQLVLEIQQEYEDKVHILLRQMPNSSESGGRCSGSEEEKLLRERLNFLETELAKFDEIKEQLHEKINECENLKRQQVRSKTRNVLSATVSMAAPNQPPPRKIVKKSYDFPQEKYSSDLDLSSENFASEDDEKRDPDWHNTPLMMRIQKLKMKNSQYMKNPDFDSSDSEFETTKRPPKRKSDDSKCSCKTGCVSKRCKCSKINRLCTENCGCTVKCKNRKLFHPQDEEPTSTAHF